MLRASLVLACLAGSLVVPQPASGQTVNPDGSVSAGPTAEQPLARKGFVTKQTAVTITFDDLGAGEVVAANRYEPQGVLVSIGPNGSGGSITGSGSAGPCNGTRSVQSEPFVGPSLLFRFPDGASDVSLLSGDFGPSDEDVITLTAYGDDALTMVVASQTVTLAEGIPPTCLPLTVAADRIAAVEVTSAGIFTNSVFVDDLVFTPAPQYVVQLEKRRDTDIEAGNNYSENATIRATVVYPPGDPNAGRQVRDFNGMITFEEDAGTTYYDGMDGATMLPMMVAANSGRAEIEIKSVSNSTNGTGPIDARIRATGEGLMEDAATNPLAIDQWVDENSDGFIDWLDEWSADIHGCARGAGGELQTIERRVSSLDQDANTSRCGSTPNMPANRSPIFISPVCSFGGQNVHRLNTNNELSVTVIHEARHAWQNYQRNARRGTDDDGMRATYRNDDDLDFWLQVVDFTSADDITEMIGGTGDTTPDPGGIPAWEVDAEDFGVANRNACP